MISGGLFDFEFRIWQQVSIHTQVCQLTGRSNTTSVK